MVIDRLIRRFDCIKDDDLNITKRGIAYQNKASEYCYDKEYYECFKGYSNSRECEAINSARIDLVKSNFNGKVLDIGIGAGDFIKKYKDAKGFDINPHAVNWLMEENLYSDEFSTFNGYTMWDVLEHIPEPENYLKRLPRYGYLFCTVPIVNLDEIRRSKHYKPNEHLYYFTEEGIIFYLSLYGFRLLESTKNEVDAGREGVMSFAFIKDGPDYQYMINQYRELHNSKYYGHSASDRLKYIFPLVLESGAKSILDYGCGRSDMIAHFWKDGERDIFKYDPAIPEYRKMPPNNVDLIICCEVMEHILMRDIDRVLREIRDKSEKALFVIFLQKASSRLPDGRNAHVTLLNRSEWLNWIKDYYPDAKEVNLNHLNFTLIKTW